MCASSAGSSRFATAIFSSSGRTEPARYLAEGRLDIAREHLELGARLDDVRLLLDPRDEVRLGGHEVVEPDACGALHEDPQGPVRT